MAFRFARGVVVGVLLTGLIAGPAYAETMHPTPLPRNGEPRSFPIESRTAPVENRQHEIATRVSSEDGHSETQTSAEALEMIIDASVLFGKDSDVLEPTAGQQLDAAAAQITKRGKGKLEVVGYTDDLGSEEHGLDLSKRRASRVADYLNGKIPSQIEVEVIGKGEAEPRFPNDSEPNRAKNRRVELRLK